MELLRPLPGNETSTLSSGLGESVPAGQLMTAAQLSLLGFSSRGIAALLRDDRLVRVRHGVYQDASSWNGLSEDQQDLARIHAFALTAGQGTVFSHYSAARLHGYSLWGVPAGIHVSHRHSAHAQAGGADVVVHKRAVTRDQLTDVGGLSVTTPERTVIDCCRITGFNKALVIADQALRHGADPALLHRMAAASGGLRGVRNVRRVLEFMDGRSESVGESLARASFVEMELPRPELQYEILTRFGKFRADFAWPERMLIVEFDGRTKYFEYRPMPEVLFQERRRERALVEAGWRVIRLEWADLFRPEELRRRLRAALNAEAGRFARGA